MPCNISFNSDKQIKFKLYTMQCNWISQWTSIIISPRAMQYFESYPNSATNLLNWRPCKISKQQNKKTLFFTRFFVCAFVIIIFPIQNWKLNEMNNKRCYHDWMSLFACKKPKIWIFWFRYAFRWKLFVMCRSLRSNTTKSMIFDLNKDLRWPKKKKCHANISISKNRNKI